MWLDDAGLLCLDSHRRWWRDRHSSQNLSRMSLRCLYQLHCWDCLELHHLQERDLATSTWWLFHIWDRVYQVLALVLLPTVEVFRVSDPESPCAVTFVQPFVQALVKKLAIVVLRFVEVCRVKADVWVNVAFWSFVDDFSTELFHYWTSLWFLTKRSMDFMTRSCPSFSRALSQVSTTLRWVSCMLLCVLICCL